MSIVWQHRIRHFDRPVKRRRMRGFDREALRAAVKARRGAPSGNHSSQYVVAMASLALRRATARDSGEATHTLLWLRLRERMLEKKHVARQLTAARRRPSVLRTRINLARRNREYVLVNS